MTHSHDPFNAWPRRPGWVNYEKIVEVAKKLRVEEPGLSKQEAIVKAAGLRPDLTARYHKEFRRDLTGQWDPPRG